MNGRSVVRFTGPVCPATGGQPTLPAHSVPPDPAKPPSPAAKPNTGVSETALLSCRTGPNQSWKHTPENKQARPKKSKYLMIQRYGRTERMNAKRLWRWETGGNAWRWKGWKLPPLCVSPLCQSKLSSPCVRLCRSEGARVCQSWSHLACSYKANSSSELHCPSFYEAPWLQPELELLNSELINMNWATYWDEKELLSVFCLVGLCLFWETLALRHWNSQLVQVSKNVQCRYLTIINCWFLPPTSKILVTGIECLSVLQ